MEAACEASGAFQEWNCKMPDCTLPLCFRGLTRYQFAGHVLRNCRQSEFAPLACAG